VKDAPGEDGRSGDEEADGLIAVEGFSLGFAAGLAILLGCEAFQLAVHLAVRGRIDGSLGEV
jgi:hypothetical protein